ncbi:O-antigen repeat unit transporter [Sporosarcina newyorkensis 2681]|uniref:O-antigen repeat unit transporter n=1 Tax=Sporosarcina newyorkensis 2681 TaxID=1027292 RepID=F9DNM7_9BACL|nr:lipopolysaccharide biosynthesis protein [Sporosarcina newyorkensis]EGQ27589.1 O-antigen repeat unit transporter [Sporosarcina newyorkensis 2681]
MHELNGLKNKTISGLIWSSVDVVVNHGLQFVIQLILLLLLLPEHFGVIGMVLIVIAISNSIVDSGFSQALIRDQNTSQADYSTVFYFNLCIATTIYGLLYISSPAISAFYGEPQLIGILRTLALVLIANALGIVQRVMLVKNVNFKTIAKINVMAFTTSGAITIVLALYGFGVWSLVFNTLAMQFFQTLLLWVFNRWLPSPVFNVQSFKKYLNFGYKLLLSGLLNTFYNNLFFVIIGRMYTTTQLGFYSNAVKLSDTASELLSTTVQRVSYPVLSKIQEDEKMLKSGFRKIIRLAAFINFPVMVGLAVIAYPLFGIVLGEKWLPSVTYFQLFCLAGMLYPLHAFNLNILQVKGRSDLFLMIEIVKCIVLTILIGLSLLLQLGIIGLVWAAVINSYTSLYINTYFSAKEIDYSAKRQLNDIFPMFLISICMGIFVHLTGNVLPDNHFIKLICQICIGVVFYIVVCKIAKVRELNMIYQISRDILKKYQPVPSKSSISDINSKWNPK